MATERLPEAPMMHEAPVEQGKEPFRLWQAILFFIITLLLTVSVVLVPEDYIASMGGYGYVSVFILTLVANASILMPGPAIAAALLAGKALNPWLVGLVSGVAAGLGETTGYLAGYTGSTLASRSRLYTRVEGWVQRWGALTIFILALIPSPVIDLAGIAAGTMRMRFSTYLLACLAGKTLRFTAIAWLGAWIEQVWI
jgi:membrane protein YqaA with SNARE-associated domain